MSNKDILNISDYVRKVIKQAYESVTEKKYKDGDIDIVIFKADNTIFINWKLNEYEPDAYKIPIKVRYRLKKNYSKYFDGDFEIFTRHTIDSNEELRNKIEHAGRIEFPDKENIELLESVIGEEMMLKVRGKIG
jgi:hypothetical protein